MPVKKTTKGYYELWEKGKFVRHLGNANAYAKYLKDLERLERKKLELTQKTATDAMPTGLFDVIYADPPWQYEFSESSNRDIINQYFRMTLPRIKRLRAELPVADNAILLLWATAPKLKEALDVMEAWGFVYRTSAVWDKEKIGMGYWFRGQHELLLIGVRGDFSPPIPDARYSSVIREARTEHSRKPERVYEMIETMFPTGKYLELFARSERLNWQGWGNEL